MSGELLAVRLLVPHNGKEAGELVLVDRLRAAKMEEVGIGSIEPPATVVRYEGGGYQDEAAGSKAPRVPPADKMARPKKTKAE